MASSAVITLVLATPRIVTGTYNAREPRLSDALNNRLESVVRLENAQLGRFGDPSSDDTVPVAVVPKQQIVLAYETSARAAAIASRLLPSYVPKQRAELLLLAAGLRISGVGHGLGSFEAADLQRTLKDAEDHFLPITNANVALDAEGLKSVRLPFVLLNLRHLQFIARADLGQGKHPTTDS